MATINVRVLLAVIVVMRLRRRLQAGSRVEERNTALFVLALGIMITPTPLGQGIFNVIKPQRGYQPSELAWLPPCRVHGPGGVTSSERADRPLVRASVCQAAAVR